MQLSAYLTYNVAFQLQRARRGRVNRRQVAADGWQGARLWGEARGLRAHRGALAHACVAHIHSRKTSVQYPMNLALFFHESNSKKCTTVPKF